ncbi:MAG TPA: polyribonucleotide nucleotidyltransferase [Acidobacteriota bacterium]|nr:polyribonucleotide nucleotidyltransferase [Acidobacteriota bacterium]HQM62464.1 polyribonucleotide nucleotidyltransferase [Acidobacteriota bacterium]
MIYRASVEIGGRELTIETGRLAKQANGAALIRYGDTVIMATACAATKPRENASFLPLTVDYREYTYAAGKFPGGFHKREGRPSEKEILTSRLIDRPLRPLFPEGYFRDTQIVALVFSADGVNDPDTMSICGASAALYLSDIPFTTPIAGVRMGYVDNQHVVNPTPAQLAASRLNLVVAGSEDALVMVEAAAKEVSEEVLLESLLLAHEQIRKIIGLIKHLAQQKQPVKPVVEPPVMPAEAVAEVRQAVADKILAALYTPGKLASERAMGAVKDELLGAISEEEKEKKVLFGGIFEKLKEEIFREEILVKGTRPDRRGTEEIRPIDIEVGVMPRTHGSALFTRGETQALVTATLGTPEDTQIMDTLDGESEKTFMVHYNFPPFSVGEVAFLRGPGRREIGHGALAEKALKAMAPAEEQFPYTIRVVSDILESNGSSSMATVCGGSLALMDAGVPIPKHIAGVAMGLIKEGDRYAVLTDIAGFEDHYGDMDFKVAGTVDGVTALQMDIKITGITPEIMKQALDQAKRGRMYILGKMNAVLAKPRENLAANAPRLHTMEIAVHRIKDLIGPGGKNIKAIVLATGAKIDIEDDGKVKIYASDEQSAQDAIRRINELCEEAEIGKVYTGRVTRLETYGAFVEIFPGTEGLMHISEVAHQRTHDIRDVVNVGDEIQVKVLGIEPPNKIRLSMKALQEPPAGMEESGSSESHGHHREHRDRREGHGDRDRGPRGPRRH